MTEESHVLAEVFSMNMDFMVSEHNDVVSIRNLSHSARLLIYEKDLRDRRQPRLVMIIPPGEFLYPMGMKAEDLMSMMFKFELAEESDD